MNSARSYEAALGSTLAHEALLREQGAWIGGSSAMDVARQVIGSTEAEALKQYRKMQSPEYILGERYMELLGSGSTAKAMLQAFEDSKKAQALKMLGSLDPVADIRRSLMGSDSSAMEMARLVGEPSSAWSAAKMMEREAEKSQAYIKELLNGMGVGITAKRMAEEFERINRQWLVPGDVLGVGATLRQVQEQLRATSGIPTIDLGTAASLAKSMGPVGLELQLALLGIRPDGSLQDPPAPSERGILSRRQSDALALVSLLLSLLFFFYQEYNNAQQQLKSDAHQAAQSAKLDAQARQIESLAGLIGKALEQAAQSPAERYVVRGRPVTVRSKPEHGARSEAELMPNEVVRAIDRDGKWVEVEYYHWLEEQYRTGWVLKKYMERVPANFAASSR